MRSQDEIRHHYLVEKELADKLRNAPAEKRGALYGQVYDELFRRVPTHPQLTRKQAPGQQNEAIAERMALLRRFLEKDSVFLEVGAGDCSLTRAVAPHVNKCYALDVSREILEESRAPNMEVLLSDGASIPVPPGSVDVVYSYQVMEHIHPQDALSQLQHIIRALAPSGKYICVTPSRLNGPHDVSQFFDEVASGFHLREYSFGELDTLFKSAGFRETTPYVGFRHRYVALPGFMVRAFEALMDCLPRRVRRYVGNLRGVSNLLFISICATK